MKIEKVFGKFPDDCNGSCSTKQFEEDEKPFTVSVNYGVAHKYQHEDVLYVKCRVCFGFDFEIQVQVMNSADNAELYKQAYEKMREKNSRYFLKLAFQSLDTNELAKCFSAMYDVGVRHGKCARSKEFRKLLEVEQYDDVL